MNKTTKGTYNGVSLIQMSTSVRAALAVTEINTGNYDPQSNKDIRQVSKLYGVSQRTIGQLARIAREHPSRFTEVHDGSISVGGLHEAIYL